MTGYPYYLAHKIIPADMVTLSYEKQSQAYTIWTFGLEGRCVFLLIYIFAIRLAKL